MNKRHAAYWSSKRNHHIPVAWARRMNVFDSLQEMRIRWFGGCTNQMNKLRADIMMQNKIKGGPMVAGSNNNMMRCLARHKVRHTRQGLIAFAFLLLFASNAQAQNFVNTSGGKYTGPGLFRVKNLATGLPDTVTGTFEYFGTGKQTIESKKYENLSIKGDENTTRTTTAGDLGILKTVAIADGVRFEVASTIMNLDTTGRITNEDGVIIGKVKSTVDFKNAPTDSSDFGGIGLSIRSNGTSPGTTDVLRTSGSSITGSSGNKSIQRVYDVTPTETSGFDGKIYFRYAKDELDNQDSTTLDLWRSADGITWRRQHTVRDGHSLELERTGKFLKGSWTASDASHLLGRKNYEFDPDSIYASVTDSLKGRVNKVLDNPFIVQVVDVYGNPIPYAKVRFSIDSIPDGAMGQALIQSDTVTNSLGQAKTYLTLGSLRGRYDVIAKVEFGDSARITFHGYGVSGIQSLDPQPYTSNGSIKQVVGPLVVTALDDQDSSVAFAEVRFSIDSIPDRATKQEVTQSDTITNALGQAQAYVRLGEKSGDYKIVARSVEDSTVLATFIVTAKPGFAALAWKDANIKPDTIGAAMSEFKYRITDSDTNGVSQRPVSIALIRPDGTAADSTLDTTGTSGWISKTFNFGDKIGNYIIKAVDVNLAGSERYDTCIATHGRITKVTQSFTSLSDTIGTVLPFGVTLADRADNPVDSEYVRYSLVSMPDSLLAHLSADSVMTESSGKAPIQLTLGEKVGTYTVQASIATLGEIAPPFIFTALHGMPQQFLAERGQNPIQEQEILQPLSMPFEVRLTDRANNPISDSTVFFAIIDTPAGATGQVLSRVTVPTDVNGLASTVLTLGDKIDEYKVRATSVQLLAPVEFTAKAKSGAAKTLAKGLGGNQEKQILTVLDTAFTVKVTDIGGNPVPNISITFAIDSIPAGAWGYQIGHNSVWADSIVTVQTDSLGIAESYLKFGSKKGSYRVIAASPSLTDTARFDVNAKVGAPKTLAGSSGNLQVGQVGDLLNPFVVQVSDTGDNLVPGANVTFTIIQQPDSTGMLSDSTVNTDSSGRAFTILTLGGKGRYTVRASLAGLKDTIFIAEAILLMADVNNDNYLNIGDLTAIIDHITGRSKLTGYAFNKADMYPIHPNGSTGDRIVDYRDAITCRDSLLSAGWIPTDDYLKKSVLPSLRINGTSSITGSGSTLLTSTLDSCYIQTTHIGSRFSLKNTVPIKGLQAVIYMRQPAILDTTDVVFPRASMMQANVKSVGKEVTVILWNTSNTPIEPGDEAIFRLPIQLTTNNVDSINVLMSTTDNNVVSLLKSKSVDIRNSIPRDWMLYQNYPNPFNPSTTIEFDVPEIAGKIPRVAVQIFNILGQHVTTIYRDTRDAGRCKVPWDGRSDNGIRVASGTYFYRLLAGDYTSTKKMVMLK